MKTVWIVNYYEDHEGADLCGVYSTREKAVDALREMRKNLVFNGVANIGCLETDHTDRSVGFGVTAGGYLAEEHTIDADIFAEEE